MKILKWISEKYFEEIIFFVHVYHEMVHLSKIHKTFCLTDDEDEDDAVATGNQAPAGQQAQPAQQSSSDDDGKNLDT